MSRFRQDAQYSALTIQSTGCKLTDALNKRGTNLPDDIFDLCKKLERHIDIAEWAAWMVKAEAKNYHDKVVFTFPNEFHRDYASMRLRHGIQEYFNKPVVMVVR